MSQEHHLKPQSFGSDLLLEIGRAVLDFSEGLEYPRIAAYRGGVEAVREFKRAEMYKQRRDAMWRLEKARFIKVNKIGDKFVGKLTQKGLAEFLYQAVADCDMLPDGHFCLVVFDIPEDRRDVRQELRSLLEKAAFIPIQKSVWASPFDAADELARFLRFKNRKRWVRIFRSVEVS